MYAQLLGRITPIFLDEDTCLERSTDLPLGHPARMTLISLTPEPQLFSCWWSQPGLETSGLGWTKLVLCPGVGSILEPLTWPDPESLFSLSVWPFYFHRGGSQLLLMNPIHNELTEVTDFHWQTANFQHGRVRTSKYLLLHKHNESTGKSVKTNYFKFWKLTKGFQ